LGTEVTTTIISGVLSLIGTFGSILLTHHLATKQQGRAAGSAVGPAPARQGPRGAGWVLPPLMLLFAVGIGYVSQARDSWGNDSYKSLSYLIGMAALVLLWWRARRDGAGYRAFVFDMLILSAGWVAGVSFTRAGFSLGADRTSTGAVFFAVTVIAGGLVFLIVRRGRATGRPT
jgi:hypothetical protein